MVALGMVAGYVGAGSVLFLDLGLVTESYFTSCKRITLRIYDAGASITLSFNKVTKTVFKEPWNVIQPRKPCIRADHGNSRVCVCVHTCGSVCMAMCGEHMGI